MHKVPVSRVDRFVALDGLRGVAAACVVIFHYAQHLDLDWMHRAWIAVDLFFILSGFVLMHSYGTKIEQGMSFTSFARVRLTRLYPLYFIGLVMGIVAASIQIWLGTQSFSLTNLANAALAGLFVIPYFNNAYWPVGIDEVKAPLFPLNDPSWSLFFELLVNVIFFLWIVKAKGKGILIILISSLSAYLYISYILDGQSGGWGNGNFSVGIPRVIYQFFLGALLYKIAPHITSKIKTLAPILVITLLFMFEYKASGIRPILLFVVAPLVVLTNSFVSLSGFSASCAKWLGDISYPLYIVHFPLFRLLTLTKINEWPADQQIAFSFIAAFLTAWIFSKADTWFREFLKPRNKSNALQAK